jgi:hypothetical protein
MCATLLKNCAIICLILTASAQGAAGSGTHPSAWLSLEHSGVVYAIGIMISLGTAGMIKLLTVTLRNLRGDQPTGK